MSYRTNIAYLYDGTFPGLMSCVFESYYKREIPLVILTYDMAQGVLYPVKEIQTNRESAQKVSKAIAQKISGEAMRLIKLVYYSCLEEKELCILRFIKLGFKVGAPITKMLTDSRVEVLDKAARYVLNEKLLYCEFIRFSELDNVLISTIEPNNFVLPLIQNHFCDRFPGESFMIYDKVHNYALLHHKGKKEIIPINQITFPDAGSEELKYRNLWRRFYDAIAIESRINPKCRMSHMPKRYWSQMTEFQTEDNKTKRLDG